MAENPLPVTIISGFLGSGKTTLLKRILSASKNVDRIAVIENELGDVPVDDLILAEFARDKRFDRLGCFTYSAEEDTIAAGFEDQVA